MGKLEILDCTLRDGGYVNDWQFGYESITGIANLNSQSGIDILETGFMRNEPFSRERAIYSCMEEIYSVFGKPDNVRLAAMIETGCLLPIEMVEDRKDNYVDLVRFITWKNKLDLAYDYCAALKVKGYEVCIQPTRVDQYSLEEFRDLIRKFNALEPYAVYIVDTFGMLSYQRLLEYVKVADEELCSNARIGYHAHNNFMQSVGNAERFIEAETTHDKIIDASVMGIGRGAGNLPLEILLRTLNVNYGGEYSIEPLISAAERYVERVYEKNTWGYSIPFFVTADCHANPNYALEARKNEIRDSELKEFLDCLPEYEKIRFNPENMKEYKRNKI